MRSHAGAVGAALLGFALLGGPALAADPDFATFDEVPVGAAAARDGRVFIASRGPSIPRCR